EMLETALDRRRLGVRVLRHDHHQDQVHDQAGAAEERRHHEGEPDPDRVDAEIVRESPGHAGDHLPLGSPDQPATSFRAHLHHRSHPPVLSFGHGSSMRDPSPLRYRWNPWTYPEIVSPNI